MNKLRLNPRLKLKNIFSLLALIFSFQAYALDDINCGTIGGFEFSNGSTIVAINNNESYYIGDLPDNFHVNLIVNGFSESVSFKIKNKTTGQTYNLDENNLPYTFPAGNSAWNFGYGKFEVEAKIFNYDNNEGSYCDKEKIKFKILETPPCGSITGYVFTDGITSVPISHDQTYDVNSLPANFYFEAVIDGFSESASIEIKNRYANSAFIIEENNLPFTYPSNQQAWDIGPAEFEIKTRIYQDDDISGPKCDELNIKFTLFDSSIPDCGCHGGIFSLTFTYPGSEVLTVNNGEITNNGDGSYTLTKGGIAISDPEISINGTQIAKIHTSCSKNLLGVIFPEGITITSYIDSSGNLSSIYGCGGEEEEEECNATAGTVTPETSVIVNSLTITAIPNGDAVIDPGYVLGTVLTQGIDLTIQAISATNVVTAPTHGTYNIHAFVYNPNTFDISSVQIGTTTATDLFNTILDNGICASLDTAGASVTILGPAERVQDVRLYPNPVERTLNVAINLLDNEEMQYEVFDFSGRSVLAGEITTTSQGNKVDITDMQNGLYFINFSSNKRSFSKKIQVRK